MSSLVIPDDLSTVTYAVRDHVAHVTLNRPEVHNAFNERMQTELEASGVRFGSTRGEGRGADRRGERRSVPGSIVAIFRRTENTTPSPTTTRARRSDRRARGCGSPSSLRSTAWHVAARSTSWVRATSSSRRQSATFFDPHVTYGMTAAHRAHPLDQQDGVRGPGANESGRWLERMSAQTARQAGLVSEVVAPEELLETSRSR